MYPSGTVYSCETKVWAGGNSGRVDSDLRGGFLELSPLPQHLLTYLIEDARVGPRVSDLVRPFRRFGVGWVSPNLGIRN